MLVIFLKVVGLVVGMFFMVFFMVLIIFVGRFLWVVKGLDVILGDF